MHCTTPHFSMKPPIETHNETDPRNKKKKGKKKEKKNKK
jgi:hypothetical protein